MILASAQAGAKIHHVTMEFMQFHPAEIQIQKGDVIIWKNLDIVSHTVTVDKQFDSSEILPEKTFRYQVKKVGEISYICRFHPMMRGKIVAQ